VRACVRACMCWTQLKRDRPGCKWLVTDRPDCHLVVVTKPGKNDFSSLKQRYIFVKTIIISKLCKHLIHVISINVKLINKNCCYCHKFSTTGISITVALRTTVWVMVCQVLSMQIAVTPTFIRSSKYSLSICFT